MILFAEMISVAEMRPKPNEGCQLVFGAGNGTDRSCASRA